MRRQGPLASHSAGLAQWGLRHVRRRLSVALSRYAENTSGGGFVIFHPPLVIEASSTTPINTFFISHGRSIFL